MITKFDDEFVEEHTNIHRSYLPVIIIDMNEDNVRESVAILKMHNTFRGSNQITDFIKRKYENDPTFKETFGYKIYSLLKEYNSIISDDSSNYGLNWGLRQYFEQTISSKNQELWNEFFPMTAVNIFHRAKNGEVVMNNLHQAAFKAKVKSTPETFNQYCKEVELLFISQGVSMQDDVVVCDTELYQDFIEKINESYEPISKHTPFGWKAFKFSMLENKLNNVGCDKFIEAINGQRKENILSGELNHEIICLSFDSMKLSSKLKQGLAEAIKRIPSDKISLDILIFSMKIFGTEPSIRKNSEIIKHLPKLKNSDFPDLNDMSTYMPVYWFGIGEFFKMSEIELGINDVRTEYSENNRLWGFLDDFFGEEIEGNKQELELDFFHKYFSASDNETKKLAIKELVFDIFEFELGVNKGPKVPDGYGYSFLPNFLRESISFSNKILLLSEILKDNLHQDYLKEMFNSDKFLMVHNNKPALQKIKETVYELGNYKDKKLVDFCFNIMMNNTEGHIEVIEQEQIV